MNVAFFATSRVSGLASIVTAIKFSKILLKFLKVYNAIDKIFKGNNCAIIIF